MAIVIAGPTASGKSALAAQLADRLGGIIINADAMQVYRDLKILTARPSEADMAARPHALYGHVDAANAHSVAAWLTDAAAALDAARKAGRPPIFVGGTGLYLAALTEGLAPIPPIPDEVRERWRLRQAAGEPLFEELRARDPVMAARLRSSDPQRIVRALEVIDATGRSLAAWQAEKARPLLPGSAAVRRIVIAPERTLLRACIAERFAAMLREGALAEVERLTARRLDPALPAMKSIGVAPLTEALRGTMSLQQAAVQAITETRQYAKRQETWFRHRFGAWPRAADPGAARELLASAGLA